MSQKETITWYSISAVGNPKRTGWYSAFHKKKYFEAWHEKSTGEWLDFVGFDCKVTLWAELPKGPKINNKGVK